MKTGLVLEGGGVRGIYTAGVLDVFVEFGRFYADDTMVAPTRWTFLMRGKTVPDFRNGSFVMAARSQ